MNDDEFERADDEIADAISANTSYFGDANQRNLLGLEFVIGDSMAAARRVPVIAGFVTQFESHANRAFEDARRWA
jgi:hypothetical protein